MTSGVIELEKEFFSEVTTLPGSSLVGVAEESLIHLMYCSYCTGRFNTTVWGKFRVKHNWCEKFRNIQSWKSWWHARGPTTLSNVRIFYSRWAQVSWTLVSEVQVVLKFIKWDLGVCSSLINQELS